MYALMNVSALNYPVHVLPIVIFNELSRILFVITNHIKQHKEDLVSFIIPLSFPNNT